MKKLILPSLILLFSAGMAQSRAGISFGISIGDHGHARGNVVICPPPVVAQCPPVMAVAPCEPVIVAPPIVVIERPAYGYRYGYYSHGRYYSHGDYGRRDGYHRR